MNVPNYIKDSSGFDLRIHSFKKLFKGNQEIDLKEKLQYSINKRGCVTLRPFERMVVGTGLIVDLPQGLKLEIVNKQGLAISQGLTTLSPPIDGNYKGEIDIILYNASQFLSEIVLNTVVAKGIISYYYKPNFVQDQVKI